jgi:uncharacterized membrane protein
MQADQPAAAPVRRQPRFEIRAATVTDIRTALGDGVRDVSRRPALSLFFGLVFALFGALLLAGFTLIDQVWIVIAAGVGFPLVAPFLAAGLYEMSRRYSRGEEFTARDILTVMAGQRSREFGWMAFVVLFVFWMWAYQVRILLAIFLLSKPIRSFDALVTMVFTTQDGLTFLAVGTVVGAILATILFSITVIAMPLLMDREVDFVTAMITSVQTVLKSPAVMLGWGALIGALTFAALAPGLIGVVVVIPVLGHASWRLYERLVTDTWG